jgi:threonine dehydrogenase-like Zn-dependent dehydrogenase
MRPTALRLNAEGHVAPGVDVGQRDDRGQLDQGCRAEGGEQPLGHLIGHGRLIHKQITFHGSWVTSMRHMEDVLDHLVGWQLHLEVVVAHRFGLDQVDQAYQVADSGAAGKVCIVMD